MAEEKQELKIKKEKRIRLQRMRSNGQAFKPGSQENF
jgi:hypothetical protein